MNELTKTDLSISMDKANVQSLILKEKVIVEATDLIANNGILMVIGTDGLYQYSYSSGTLQFLSKISTSK